VKIAYHFDADAYGTSYGFPIERAFFAALCGLKRSQLHVRIRRGDLLLYLHVREAADRERTIRERLIDPEHPVWRTVDRNAFPVVAANRDLYLLYVDGIAPGDAKRVDRQLRADERYLGALEINLANPVQWVLYDQQLSLSYRVVGDELRLLHVASELEPELPTGLKSDWERSGLFAKVELEDVGLQDTLSDPYRTPEHARREAELEDLLSGHFSGVVTETLIRTGDLDPVLRDVLHAALSSFESFHSGEQLAHVGLSARRFLERLADVLYPARTDTKNGRDLSQGKYINRLWAYVEDNLQGTQRTLVIATLQDVGQRIDALSTLANKGLHAPRVSAPEMQRLLVGLVTVTYDVLSLGPPPGARMEPYTESLVAFAEGLFGEDEDEEEEEEEEEEER
jgi:hypothetical protein